MQTYFQGAYYIATLAIGLFLGILLGHLSLSYTVSSSFNIRLIENSQTPSSSFHEIPKLTARRVPPAIEDYQPFELEDSDEQWWENFESNRTLYLSAVAGIGNTLQSIASAFRIAVKEKIKMKFVFYRHEHGYGFGPARWGQLFSFPRINADYTFPDGKVNHETTKACGKELEEIYNWNDDLKNGINWLPEKNGNGEYYCFKASQWKEPPFPQSALWFYRNLRPTDEIQHYIKNFKVKQEWDKYQWIGVHIRRSDNGDWMRGGLNNEQQEELKGEVDTTSMDTMLPIEHYIETMKNLEKEWSIHQLGNEQRVKPTRFFLATDNDEAKQRVLDIFGDEKVVFFADRMNRRKLRKDVWGMKLAIIDLYLLASCRLLVGTPFSTFSEAAHLIGNNFYLEVNFAYTT